MKWIGIIAAGILFSAYTVFAAQTLWGWFVESQLGFATPSFWGMWGLVVTVALMRGRVSFRSEDIDYGHALTYGFSTATVSLGFGWLAKTAGGF